MYVSEALLIDVSKTSGQLTRDINSGLAIRMLHHLMLSSSFAAAYKLLRCPCDAEEEHKVFINCRYVRQRNSITRLDQSLRLI